MGRVVLEEMVPLTPSEFVLRVHRVATEPHLSRPYDVTRLGLTIELTMAGAETAAGIVPIHMVPIAGGTVIRLEEQPVVELESDPGRLAEMFVRRVLADIAVYPR
jgi:hypothetical protein